MDEVLREQEYLKAKKKKKDLMKWLLKIRNNLKLVVKENRIENCSQCQKNMNLNLQFIPYVERKYWREDHGKRATQQGFVLKICVLRASHHFIEQDSATKRNHTE